MKRYYCTNFRKEDDKLCAVALYDVRRDVYMNQKGSETNVGQIEIYPIIYAYSR